ncbi:restriction endonuclease, partial [Corynebacterium diphtheriae]
MPFISQVLGYDVFDPQEVVPEFVADLGLKKGEKIDYAIMREGKVNILVEAKKVGSELSLAHASQLVRYFHTSEARIGVLTNGRVWNFYTDLDKANILDERP